MNKLMDESEEQMAPGSFLRVMNCAQLFIGGNNPVKTNENR